MITHRKIFDADSEFSMLEKVRNADVEFPPNVFENIPSNFLQVVQKALEKNPDHRYQSAHDMRVDLENYLLTTQERLSEKTISNYLKQLFREEIDEERKILTEGTEILVERLAAQEPVLKPPAREPEKISIPKKAPVPEGERKRGFAFTSKLRFALILILFLVGGFAGAYFLTRPSSKNMMVSQRGDTSPPPARPKASPPSAATVVEAEVKPSTPAPVERPKAIEEERRKAQPVERPEPGAKAEKEASLKGPEQRPSFLLGDLISQGPQLLTENRHLRVLEQVHKLTPEERQNINVKVLECFAHLKKYVVDKDKQSKPLWSQLYEFLEKSNNRNTTPLLVKITKDPEEYTRLYAVTLLGSIGDHRAIGDLQQIANSDPNRKIRRSAAKSITLIQKRG
jgi:hypothetical protein